MKILIAGSTGLIGTHLVTSLKQRGHELVRLVRSDTCLIERCLQWEPYAGKIDADRLNGFDAVLSLGGANLSSRRWSASYKKELVDSRLIPTRLLAETIADLDRKPKLWLSASAIGFYGVNPSGPVDETSPAGDDFLAQLCVDWEAACDPARKAGVRVITLRTGAVLTPEGGALGKMLPLFKLGLGGQLASGRQMMSWIALEDMIGAVVHLLKSNTLTGPVNLVSPNPVSNAEFTRTLASILKRLAIIPAPAFAMKLILGEMATYLALSSLTVTPKKLINSGFHYKTPQLVDCLTKLVY
jgi:hypothetical protein